jgi:GNAT superfamily N-acetyltransferase
MSSSLPETLTLRPATPDDADAVNELMVAADVAVQGWSDGSVDELRTWWRRNDPEENSWLLLDDGGVVAYGDCFAHADWVELDGYVRPDRKGEGLGTWLIERAEERARAAGAARLQTFCLAPDTDARRLFAQHGFAEVRRYYRMLIELGEAPEEPEWPDGLRVATFDERDAQAFYDALGEAFAEEWNFVQDPYDEWRELRLSAPDFDPTMWFLVWDGDEVAAVLRGERRGEQGWIGAVGVRRGWRKRGLGLALLRHTFADWFRRGVTTVALGVDAANPTGATRLYERAGMHVGYEAIAFQKELR